MTKKAHPKLCQCGNCVNRRFEDYQERIESYLKQGIVPRSIEQTVMVKRYEVAPHFRRNPHHMTRDEAVRSAVGSYLKGLFTKSGELNAKAVASAKSGKR